jgi:hypothetical protein
MARCPDKAQQCHGMLVKHQTRASCTHFCLGVISSSNNMHTQFVMRCFLNASLQVPSSQSLMVANTSLLPACSNPTSRSDSSPSLSLSSPPPVILEKLKFHVLASPQCPHNLILGQQILALSEMKLNCTSMETDNLGDKVLFHPHKYFQNNFKLHVLLRSSPIRVEIAKSY